MVDGLDPDFFDAAEFGDIDYAKLLFQASLNDDSYYLDLDATDNSGTTALMIATRYGHCEFVKWLLETGANPHQKDKNGNTALDLALKTNHEATIKILNAYSNQENG